MAEIPTFPKDEKTMVISIETRGCHREHKYPPEDPRRQCHLGMEKIDQRICQHCVHSYSGGARPMAALTGQTIVQMVEAMKQVQNGNVDTMADVGAVK